MSLLAGDVGGTSTRLAWFEPSLPRPRLIHDKTYPSRQYRGLGEVLTEFLREFPLAAESACFGVPGPVRNGRVETPNLPWLIETAALSATLSCPRVILINDLEANAWGIPALAPGDLVCLNEGFKAAGNACVISAGTGLGEAGLFWDGTRHHPFATEGGHADFAPRNALEASLAQALSQQFGRISIERIVSGPGIVLIYEHLRAGTPAPDAATLAAALDESDFSAAISRSAHDNPVAERAMQLFVSLYGAEAGNWALKMLATGGVYIGGGIAPKIIARMRGGGFMEAYLDKGRMRGLLESMPVHVILDDKTALLGAARCAAAQ